jgi:VIT1/CCC1 family predicted Fe2+/Mn2+ transporter
MTDTNKRAQYVVNWQDERNGAALYRAISEVEKNPQLKSVYQRLPEAEERHSGFWEAKLRAAGQIIAVAPFFFLSGLVGVIVSICCATVALFGIGAGITLLTGRNVFYSGARQVILGLLAAGITFGLGRVIGTSLTG